MIYVPALCVVLGLSACCNVTLPVGASEASEAAEAVCFQFKKCLINDAQYISSIVRM